MTASEPKVRGESRYDRVTSMLMAVVMGAVLVFGWLALVYATSQAYASRVAAPLTIIEVYGGGGGSPDGEAGGVEDIIVPGAAAGERASNNEVDAADFEAPTVEATPGAMLDAAMSAGATDSEVDLGPAMPTGGKIASGPRASRIGNGKKGIGVGEGDGGVPAEQRWSILFNPGQTAGEYGRQLDFFHVELGTVYGPDSFVYAANLSSPTPTSRIGRSRDEKRLYFLWQGAGRKGSDVELLSKANIPVGNKPIFQFYPKEVEATLAELEVRYRGRQPIDIRTTRFRVVPKDDGYGFEVLDQVPLR